MVDVRIDNGSWIVVQSPVERELGCCVAGVGTREGRDLGGGQTRVKITALFERDGGAVSRRGEEE